MRGEDEDSRACSVRARCLPCGEWPSGGRRGYREDGDRGRRERCMHLAPQMVGAHAGGRRLLCRPASFVIPWTVADSVLATFACPVAPTPRGTRVVVGPLTVGPACQRQPRPEICPFPLPCVLDRGRGEDGRKLNKIMAKQNGQNSSQGKSTEWKTQMAIIKNDSLASVV